MTEHKIKVQIERSSSGLLIATSTDLPGLHLIERSNEELFVALREMIPFIFSRKGKQITVVDIKSTKDTSTLNAEFVASIQATKSEYV